MIVFMANEDAFASASQAMELVMLLEALQAREHRGVFFGLVLLGAKGVVRERVEPNCFWLVRIEAEREDRRI